MKRVKTTQRFACEHYYLRIKLEFPSPPSQFISAQIFQSTIIQALEQMFGESGSSIAVDLLQYSQNNCEAVIRVPKKALNKVWSSLTLFGKYGDLDCAFRVIKVSPFLACLASNSRLYVHE